MTMKKKLLLLVLLIGCCVAQGQTIYVSGEQSGVWDADTVVVTGDVTVWESLLVRPGTVVLFDGFHGIAIYKDASFVAQGTETDSIVFTVADTTGFYHYELEDGGWNGFYLLRAGHFLLDYCVLEYGKAFINDDWFGGLLEIVSCDDVNIHHSTLRHSAAHERGGALSAVDSRVLMTGSAVNYNTVYNEENMYLYGGGASFLKCDVELREMEFRGNDAPTIGGALSFDSCSVVLDRSVFVDNIGVNGAGLYLMRSFERECLLSNLLFDDNYSRHFGGGFAISDASPEIYNVLVVNNSSEGVSCNGIFFYGQSSPRLSNCIICGNYAPDPSVIVDTAQMWVWTTNGYAPEFRNCLIEGGTSYIHSSEYIQVFEDIIDADPGFVDAVNHDFHLGPDSPCLDAGWLETPDYITQGVDLDGMPRCQNQRIDIGPYEFLTTSTEKREAPPAFAGLVGNPLGRHSRVEIDANMEGEAVVTVCSLTGRCLGKRAFNLEHSRNLEIGDLVEGLASGFYLVEIAVSDKICTIKAIK